MKVIDPPKVEVGNINYGECFVAGDGYLYLVCKDKEQHFFVVRLGDGRKFDMCDFPEPVQQVTARVTYE